MGRVDERLINALERLSVGDIRPDLTIVLDLPVVVGLERAELRRGSSAPDRFEGEKVDFHEQLRQAYLGLAATAPERCVIIDASGTKDEIAKRVWAAVNARLDPAMAPMSFENVAS
jgi:dTMP kinase